MNVKEVVKRLSDCSDFKGTYIFFRNKKGRIFPINSICFEEKEVVGKNKIKKNKTVIYFSDEDEVKLNESE